MYTLERTHCKCYQETCNCDPWSIEEDGKSIVTIYPKDIGDDTGELIVKALNYYKTMNYGQG